MKGKCQSAKQNYRTHQTTLHSRTDGWKILCACFVCAGVLFSTSHAPKVSFLRKSQCGRDKKERKKKSKEAIAENS